MTTRKPLTRAEREDVTEAIDQMIDLLRSAMDDAADPETEEADRRRMARLRSARRKLE